MNRHKNVLAVAMVAALALPCVHATDVVVLPSSGSGFVVKDASGANERLRVQESGAVSLPSVAAAPTQAQALCMSAGGQLGPCSGAGGGSYTAATGLALTGTTFSVAPTYRLPQGCAANQMAQWNGADWVCGSAGGANLPAGQENQTLRYDASKALVANNLLQAFSDGGLVAGGTFGTGIIPATGAGTRLMWFPKIAALRAGGVGGAEWDETNIGNYSVAMGLATKASGGTSVAMGDSTTASGGASTAMGGGTIASGNLATAMGGGTTAIGPSSFATGSQTTASGAASTAMGYFTTAEKDYATAVGNGSHATGEGSTAMGSSVASGDYSTAIGRSVASGNYSTSMGVNTYAIGNSSTAMGLHTTASGVSSTAMGISTTASGSHSTAMGESTVADGISSTAMGSSVGTGSFAGSFIYGDASTRPFYTNTATNQFEVFASGGINLYSGWDPDPTSPTYKQPIGSALAANSGSWTTISDRNMKTAIQPIDGREVLQKVVALPLSTWQYRPQDPKYRHMGPMAQDFYAAFHLGESDKGIDTVDADGVALAAIQGLHAMLEDKEAQIISLRAETVESTKRKDAEIAALRAELAEQKRVAALESLAGDLREVKAQLARLRTLVPEEVVLASRHAQ